MALFHKTRSLVTRLSPEPICDDCIADKLDIADISEVIIKTTELATNMGFEKINASCGICDQRKRVMRHL